MAADMEGIWDSNVGKVAVHTAAAGIPPQWTLPIALDVGCDTATVRDDPLYVGLNQVAPHAVTAFSLASAPRL